MTKGVRKSVPNVGWGNETARLTFGREVLTRLTDLMIFDTA